MALIHTGMELSAFARKKRRATGMYCMAPGCTNYRGKDRTKHYHRLPLAHHVLLQQWMRKMKFGRTPSRLEHARVCSAHFTDRDYVQRTSAFIPRPPRV